MCCQDYFKFLDGFLSEWLLVRYSYPTLIHVALFLTSVATLVDSGVRRFPQQMKH